MRYRHLLSPARIGPVELRNRIVMTPMGDDLGEADGRVSEAQCAYLEARAAGGVALVMLGSISVAHPAGCSNPRQTAISEDRFIAGWKRAANAVHGRGGKLAMQLSHAGKNGVQDVMHGRPLWTPSVPGTATSDPLMNLVTREERSRMSEPYTQPTSSVDYRVMSHEDIESVVQQFADAAQRAAEAGVDGVEVHGGHGYLIDAFLSPSVNKRSDEYGGPIENRARFLREILQAMRARVGDSLAIWVRLNSVEKHVAGTSLEDAIRTAKLAEQAGADAVHATAYHDPGAATGPTDSYIPHAPGLLVPNAAAIRRELGVPVIAVGRISPEQADRCIAAGDFDFVAMGRALLADPELPNKLAAGNGDAVRPCVHQYRCIGNIYLRKAVRCAANAQTGRETELHFRDAGAPKHVLVVGGGPAGLEAARVARLRGHEVTLVEQNSTLGGRFRLSAAAVAPNGELLRWFERQLQVLGVALEVGVRVDAAWVERAAPGAVIVATGAHWLRPALPGADDPRVRTVDELEGWLVEGERLGAAGPEPQRVVVIGADVPGLALAEKALRERASVVLLSADSAIGNALGLPGRWRRASDLVASGGRIVTGSEVLRIDAAGVHYRDANGEQHEPADQILVTSRIEADATLASEIGRRGIPAYAVGDCAEPGLLEGAIRSAATLAAEI